MLLYDEKKKTNANKIVENFVVSRLALRENKKRVGRYRMRVPNP